MWWVKTGPWMSTLLLPLTPSLDMSVLPSLIGPLSTGCPKGLLGSKMMLLFHLFCTNNFPWPPSERINSKAFTKDM